MALAGRSAVHSPKRTRRFTMTFGYYYNEALTDNMSIRNAAEFALTQKLNEFSYENVEAVNDADLTALLAIVPLAMDIDSLERLASAYDMGATVQAVRDGSTFVSNVEHLAAQINKAGLEMLKYDLSNE